MRYVVVTFALCLLVVSAQAGTYVENFDDGNYDGWEIFDGGESGAEWTIEDGVLTCRREMLWMAELLFGEEDWRNYTIECDARMVEPLGDELCLIAFDTRVTGTEIVDGQPQIDGVTTVLGYLSQEAWISAWIDNDYVGGSENKPIEFELDRWYRLKAVVHEDSFQFYLDGRLVASYTDDRFPTGRLGLFAAACEAQFDNVIITGDDVPDNTDSLVEGDLLAAMYWFEEAWRMKNADLFFSIFTDDAMFDNIPYPPMNVEEDRPFVDDWMSAVPTFDVLRGAFHKASAEDGVGFMEHTDTYVWSDNGAAIEEFHICLLDFRGSKAKRLTVYADWGTSLIQAGLMPPHDLGDMMPSFLLPAPERTGLIPMEASAELIARLNSHDLSSVAEMIRYDVDVWFPFIGRLANRSEFIDIHEQFLGGFSDMSWESVKRVDMGDGWVFSEVKLRGTNDGEFLGKAATGLPMEVRSGLIEHYDENGLADYIHFHFDTLSVPGQSVPTDEAKEEILAIMKAMDEAYRALDADLVVSHYAEDAIIDCPPFGQWGKEEDREFIEDLIAAYPTFSIVNAHYLASGSEKVGIAEHSSNWVFPDTGIPYHGFHICAHDFEEGKMKRLTCYIDWAAELIQSGAMPHRNLGDMIPSFPLPAPEPTGLASMGASGELLKRLNSHDLSSVAKMIRTDVDVWFSFIDRTANRREFISIHEKMLGGFSDMSWENVRRVDMGDGWVFSEVKMMGTNDGEFLGKPDTGLPMEVRTGWIEHYDGDGLADHVHIHFDTLSVPGQEAPTGPVEDFSNVFFMELASGLNMISLPLKPQTSYTARSLAEEIGATVVIAYDETQGRFVGFTSGSQGDGFPIEGGKGYIVNVVEGKTHTFTGAAWTNEPSAEAAPPASMDSAWAFVVSGSIIESEGVSVGDGDYSVTVKNLRTGDTFTGSVSSGYFAAAHADLSRKPVIEVGDRIEVAVLDSSGELVSGPYIHEATLEGIRNAAVNVRLRMGHIIPEKSALLQNYPNPFNPETWIPFHLKSEASVSVRIYSINGQLIRTLDLGHRDAGIYVSRSDAAYWDGKSESGEEVASGIYYYTIDAGDFYATRKMIVRK